MRSITAGRSRCERSCCAEVEDGREREGVGERGDPKRARANGGERRQNHSETTDILYVSGRGMASTRFRINREKEIFDRNVSESPFN